MCKRIVAMGLLMTALTVLVFVGYQAAAEPDANAGATPGESSPSSDLRAKIAEAHDARLHALLAEDEEKARQMLERIAEDEAEAERLDDMAQRAKVAAGPNANARLSLDLIPNGGSGNRRNDGVTSGTVSGRGTTIAIEVFATGVTTSLTGMQIGFDFDATLLTYVKAENSAFTLPLPASTGTDFAATPPVTLPSSGFLTRAEFTTATNVTGREFSIGIASVTLSESSSSSDMLTTTNRIEFNATTARTPDFDGNGTVGFSDFMAFAEQYRSRRGDGRYQVRYDLNRDGAIDFSDFLIFVGSYDGPVSPPGGGSSRSDLIVESPSVSDNTLTTGQSFTLRATVRNSGTGRSASTTLRYYRSSNSSISTSDTEVGTDSVSGLSASGTSAESISLTAPSSSGTYYYGACVASVSGESNSNNNCSDGVRVTVSSGSGGGRDDHSNTRSGATSLSLGGSRSGQIETGGDVDYFRVQVSTSGTLTVYTTGNTDTYGTLQNSSGSALENDDDDGDGTNFSIARAVSAGTYYVEVKGYNSAETGSYTLHARFVSGSGGGGSSRPDLIVQSPSVSDNTLTTGQSFTLRATVRNSGTGSAAATTLRYYRSSNSSISTSDTEVGTDSVSGLSASGTSSESISLTAPSSSGTYYYGACVASVSGESNSNNNCSDGVRVTVSSSRPDLIVQSPSVSDNTLTTGQSFTLRATVRNSGTGRSASTTLRYYRSSNSSISTSDTEVGTDSVSGLSASGTSAESISLTAPSSSGTYYYGACVASVSGESNTNNNCSDGVRVTVSSSRPDLIVQSPSVSDNTLTTGQSFTLRATVRNSGTGRSASTTLRYYRSSNSTISTSDTQVGTDSVSGLSASGTSAESISLTAPSSSGTYYYGACVASVSGESNTNNNCSDGVRVTVSSGSGGGSGVGDAITGSITNCSGSRDDLGVNVRIDVTLRAHREVRILIVTGYANNSYVDSKVYPSMSAGQSRNIILSGFISTSANTLSCSVKWEGTVLGSNLRGTIKEK